MFALHRLSTGEEEEDVAQHAHDRQRNQSDPKTLRKTTWTHSDTDASTSSTTQNYYSVSYSPTKLIFELNKKLTKQVYFGSKNWVWT